MASLELELEALMGMESPSPVRGPHTVETVGGPPAHTYDGYHIDREVARRRTLENAKY